MATATTHRPLRTPELLEQILSHLPARSLLRLQRVATFWRDLILRSPTLSKSLFHLPSGPVIIPTDDSHHVNGPLYSRSARINSFLYTACNTLALNLGHVCPAEGDADGRGCAHLWTLPTDILAAAVRSLPDAEACGAQRHVPYPAAHLGRLADELE